jgi:molecular chaperone Hsp33
LMQSNIKFNGALVLQVFGDGPVKLAVVEVQSNLGLRATAKLEGVLEPSASVSQLVNVHKTGRCAITLDPQDRQPGQQPYQGVVPLLADSGEPFERFSEVLQHYMLRSEQLDTTLVLAADDKVAAGLLIQRLPTQGEANLAGHNLDQQQVAHEDYQRIAMLAASLKREELLTLDTQTILHRLFWEEQILRFAPQADEPVPHFHCSCSRDRVARMLQGLGAEEAQSIVAERGEVEVGCEFCSAQYRFDAVDVAALFQATGPQAPSSDSVQ